MILADDSSNLSTAVNINNYEGIDMEILIGSARIDERGKASGGKRGDQKQTTTGGIDYKGEVAIQKFYKASKGWYILRPKTIELANRMAVGMATACNNKNIGYSQSDRYAVIKQGVETTQPCNADCSSLVRAVIIFACGKDVGDFNTSSEPTVLEKSGLFQKRIPFTNLNNTPVYDGDVLVTKTKGHTVIVVAGNPRKEAAAAKTEYYPAFNSASIVLGLKSIGVDSSKAFRAKIAAANGIVGYSGTFAQNTKLCQLAKEGKLIKP